MSSRLLTVLLLSSLVGCVDAEKTPAEAPQLSDPSKADSPGTEIVPIGELTFGGEVTGAFERDEQYDGYLFSGRAGAVITLDNAHRGSAAALDSTLFLYGPRDDNGFYGAEAIAFDDDGGWGLHGRIRDFQLPESGEYMAVLSTYLGLDRGHYRLTLECESGEPADCEPEVIVPTGPVSVTATAVQTTENGGSQVFQVQIHEQPTSQVQIWIESDDINEAVVTPMRLFFCPDGQYLSNVECRDNRVGIEPPTGGDWQRTVDVRVTGVRDALEDGDQPFTLTLRMESADPVFAAVELAPIPGINMNSTAVPNYDEFDGLADDDLLRALFSRLQDHEVFGYHGVNSARTLLFSTVDVYNGKINSLYNGVEIDVPGDSIRAYMAGFNTEHSWPQSQFDRLDPMVSDLHHIYGVDRESNSERSSYGFGYNAVGSSSSRLGSSRTDGRSRVYQVRPERRGDVARAHFYMVARYAFDDTLGIHFDDDSSDTNGRMEDLEETVLRAWNLEDPVDDRERVRNERIEALQGNRNPFIDRPELVERIRNF